MRIIKDASRYRRVPPNVFNCTSVQKDFHQYAYWMFCQDEVWCPPEGTVQLFNCSCYEAQHLINDGEWFEPSILDAKYAAQLIKALRRRLENHEYIYASNDHRENVVFCKYGAANYGHVLSDISPKLINLAHAKPGPVRLHVPFAGKAFVPLWQDLVSRLDLDAEIRVAASGELLTFERVTFLTPVAQHNTRKSPTLLELRELLLNAYGQSGRSRRLYVRRLQSEKRCISNHAHIERLFAACGFDIVYPGAMNYQEQVSLFSQASHIAGSLGAGMANLLYAPAGAEILLIDPGLCDFYFWDASNLIGQHFHWHFSGALRHFDLKVSDAPFFVEPQALWATMRAIGWTNGRRPPAAWFPRLGHAILRSIPLTVRQGKPPPEAHQAKVKAAERLLATTQIDGVSPPARLLPGSHLPLRRFRRKIRKRFARGIASLLRRH